MNAKNAKRNRVPGGLALRALRAALVLPLAAGIAATAFAAPPQGGADAAVREVIQRLNSAVTARDLPALLETFADGAVRVDLFPAHRYGAAAAADDGAVKTAPLAERWRAVAPLLFATTKSYRRSITDMEVHLDGALATAWVGIETATLPAQQGAETQRNRFTEVYVLRRQEEAWKIVMLTNNRHDRGD